MPPSEYELLNQHEDVRVLLLEARIFLPALDQDDALHGKAAIPSSSTKTVRMPALLF
ncbi:MAG: hypothetical protein H8E38_00590 [SAR324 cluster bacterium]|nr:hypothetical protein [SAR324 cluster bacterium]MBL7035662.1 hypothetical protein [SAR324 cluster bacterium]